MPLKRLLTLLLVGVMGALMLADSARSVISSPARSQTNYDLAQQAPYNRPEHYPLDQRPDPSLYKPHAEWMGRLILPARQDMTRRPGDWVWVVLEQVPVAHADLIGRRLRLGWQESPVITNLIDSVSTDIQLGAAAAKSARQGNVLPTRLDGRRSVGPLQSLAGARPRDDIIVALEEVALDEGFTPGHQADGERIPSLRIARSPIQITGRWSGLVEILGPDPSSAVGDDRYRVRHYDAGSGGFDGPVETLRIPRQPPDGNGRRMFDPSGIERNPIGKDGWMVHGSPDASGLFTVEALEPRRLFMLRADHRIEGKAAGLRHVATDNWRVTPSMRGTLGRTSLGDEQDWQVGDQALVLHNFGGIGGIDGESISGFTVTGHFAFGQARVIADPFTGQPRFALRYHQIYANNPNGIVAGSQDWSAFMGNLQRGWMGTRPVSDVLVQGDSALLPELAIQAQVLMARYRTGDGTGVSTVTPATSCVQDSSQALWIAIDQLRFQYRRKLRDPAVGPSMNTGSTAIQLERLSSLARELDQLLTPFGMVREDWRRNSERLKAARLGPSAAITTSSAEPGDEGNDGFLRGQSLGDVMLSWRSMMPRRAHDDLAQLLIRRNTPIWILRTNQLPGHPNIAPLAPTLVLGQVPILGTLLKRIADSVFTPLSWASVRLSLLLLIAYAAVVLTMGFRNGFLSSPGLTSPLPALLGQGLSLLFMPALVEEVIFRVALLPHPLEGVGRWDLMAWGALSVGVYVLYHPVAARLWYPQALQLFDDPRFLLPCALLGGVLVVIYEITGSLWPTVLMHWAVVFTWLEALGGKRFL